jgi:hypothetical protein
MPRAFCNVADMQQDKQTAKGAARRGINEAVISRGYQLFERLAMSIHNALNRVVASRADKQLSLVTKIVVIGMRATSRQ